MNCICGKPVYGADIHPCCARWWDGARCLGCQASAAAERGDIWRSKYRLEAVGGVRLVTLPLGWWID